MNAASKHNVTKHRNSYPLPEDYRAGGFFIWLLFPGRSCLGIILNDGDFIIEVIFVGIGDAKMVAKLIACPEPLAADITLYILGVAGIVRLSCFTGRAEMICLLYTSDAADEL